VVEVAGKADAKAVALDARVMMTTSKGEGENSGIK
jgi:hypothetical protein